MCPSEGEKEIGERNEIIQTEQSNRESIEREREAKSLVFESQMRERREGIEKELEEQQGDILSTEKKRKELKQGSLLFSLLALF